VRPATLACLLLSTAASFALADEAGDILFALEVKPLLESKCLACHGRDSKKVKGEFRLDSREAMLKGGESGKPGLVPDYATKSPLYLAATREDPDFAMPPKENDRLTEAQLDALKKWIDDGAPWPSPERVTELVSKHSTGITVQTSGGLNDEWTNRRYQLEDLWAYQMVKKVDPPANGHPIDAFIDHHLDKAGLAAAPLADRRTLIRRATFDLTGLTPSPQDIENFVGDSASDADAFETVIDQLLANPHYGEQWGRHWLDVARYADSSGFANDYERPNAWRYRDYVVRSFNADKPYDQFVREQLAGDELDADNPDALIATGFLRMGPWEHTGMSVAKVTRQQFFDDVTSSVGQVFFAHALQCARCHDHKFDPIPTRDYYSIQAVFASTQFADRPVPFVSDENTEGFEEDRSLFDTQLKRYRKILADLNAKQVVAAKKWCADRGLEYIPRAEALKRGLPEDKVHPRHAGFTPEDFGMERISRKNTTRLAWEMDRYNPVALSVYSGRTRPQNGNNGPIGMPENPLKGAVPVSFILTGGDVFAPLDKVEPGTISAVRSVPLAIASELKGRRKAFAEWATHPDHPLTSRVMVNRIWQFHFGKALAANPNNFGKMGSKPTHPELLDWLASTFIDLGWSMKRLHRLIMTSKAYQRASTHPDPEKFSFVDPDKTLYATFLPRRLAAEELRDSMLAVSGELIPTVGGIPARPDMNLEAALQPRMIMGTYAPAYQPNALPEQRNRRSLYALKLRGHRAPFYETFNQPSPDSSCEFRETSTVTPQALSLMNSDESQDRAIAFAARLIGEKRSRGATLSRAFHLAYGRSPSGDELASCLTHWRELEATYSGSKPPPKRVYPTEVVREAKEENTGEAFEFREPLDVYKTYIPDLQAADVDPKTRALADVCLVIINSNEFVYVY
jgi:mono/diheme cytochrome c family protein